MMFSIKRKRQIILTISSTVIIILFFLLPSNRTWVNDRIFPYYRNFQKQKNNLDIEQRKEKRFQSSYRQSKFINNFFEKKGNRDSVLVLIPPTSYFKKMGVDYTVPEPTVFYYYTGLKTVWVNSGKAEKANWFVHVREGKIVADSVANLGTLKDTIAAFKKFRITL